MAAVIHFAAQNTYLTLLMSFYRHDNFKGKNLYRGVPNIWIFTKFIFSIYLNCICVDAGAERMLRDGKSHHVLTSQTGASFAMGPKFGTGLFRMEGLAENHRKATNISTVNQTRTGFSTNRKQQPLESLTSWCVVFHKRGNTICSQWKSLNL